MEKQMKVDRVCFEKNLNALISSAVAEVYPFIESLDLYKLEENRRRGRVYLEIEKKVDQMVALNRHEYTLYYKNADYLYMILKSANRLNCPKEMEKLKRAIIYKEICDCLLLIKMKMDIRQQAADYFEKNDPELTRTLSLAGGTLDGQKLPDKSMLIKGFTLEETLMDITLQLIERLNFLVNKTSAKQFVQWLLDPDKNENEPKIYIGCMTNEFKCIMFHFKFFCKKLSYATIGRHGIFISKNGIPFSANNMRSTSFEKLNTRHAIANIFAPYM